MAIKIAGVFHAQSRLVIWMFSKAFQQSQNSNSNDSSSRTPMHNASAQF